MIAYKFRGLDQIAFALDIITESRLFCANWSSLNDPMEGVFSHIFVAEHFDVMSELITNVVQQSLKQRVCSLSESIDSHLLWAHYGSGFRGLAIEVDLPDNPKLVKKVRYVDSIPHVELGEQPSPFELAQWILSCKLKEWDYENEVRTLTKAEYESVTVRRVVVGHRSPEWMNKTLQAACQRYCVSFSRTKLKSTRIELEDVFLFE